ncbi:hypothetical protein PG985_009771 [Apiospora marii]|uniref:Uncharacterized protein n=1 Tax=Apiospora marii TaxID=335849 RepID=A0ABR1RRP7_9PEZI
MRLSSIFLPVALLLMPFTVEAATCKVLLYEKENCRGKPSHTCADLAEGGCCHKAGKKYKSGKIDNNESGDNLKLHTHTACGGIPVAQSTGCASMKKRLVEGAEVFVVVNPPRQSGADDSSGGNGTSLGPERMIGVGRAFLEQGE